MDLARAGEALIRVSHPLLPFLAPTTYRLPHTSFAIAAPIVRHCKGQPRFVTRPFTTSQWRQQQSPPEREQEQSRKSPRTQPEGTRDDLDSPLDDSTRAAPRAPARTPNPVSNITQAQRSSPLRGSSKGARSGGGGDGNAPPLSSVDELLNSMGHNNKKPRTHQSASNSGDGVMNIFDSFGDSSSYNPPPPTVEVLPVELPKNVGRLVHVDTRRNMDVARAFRTMEMQCARNSVRRDFMAQRFHERPGLKRKRLKRQRWAKRFKENFRGVVQMVQKMKRQGW